MYPQSTTFGDPRRLSHNAALEKGREYSRRYRSEHPERVHEYQREYRAAHRDEKRECSREWYLAHREKALERDHEYYEVHHEEALERKRKYYETHRDIKRKWQRHYYADHADERRAKAQEWRVAHPEESRAHGLRRRALQAGVTIEPVNASEVYERDHYLCHVCRRLVPARERSLDHLIPLTRGGAHSMNNVALAHRRCNSKRYNSGPAQLLLFHEPAK